MQESGNTSYLSASPRAECVATLPLACLRGCSGLDAHLQKQQIGVSNWMMQHAFMLHLWGGAQKHSKHGHTFIDNA